MTSKPAEHSAHASESERLDMLVEIGRAMTDPLSPDTAFRRVLEILQRRWGTPSGMVCLFNPTSGETAVCASHGHNDPGGSAPDSLGEGAVGRVIRTGRPIVVPRISGESVFPDGTAGRKAGRPAGLSYICIPILVDGNAVGALGVDVVHSKERDYGADLGCLEVVATMLAQAIRANPIPDQAHRPQLDRASHAPEESAEHGNPPSPVGNLPETSRRVPGPSFHEEVEAFERKLLLNALKTTGGNRARAARLLGTTSRILNYKVQKYQINYRLFSS